MHLARREPGIACSIAWSLAVLCLAGGCVCAVGPACLARDAPCRLEGGPGSPLTPTDIINRGLQGRGGLIDPHIVIFSWPAGGDPEKDTLLGRTDV